MSTEYDYLNEHEKEEVQELKKQVNKAATDDELKRYTTKLTLIYERARVRNKKKVRH